MNYLSILVLLFSTTDFEFRASGMVTNQMEIHFKMTPTHDRFRDDRFRDCRDRLRHIIPDEFVRWEKKKNMTWNLLASLSGSAEFYFEPGRIEAEWSGRARAHVKYSIDYTLAIDNVTHPDDSGMYRYIRSSRCDRQNIREEFPITILDITFTPPSRQQIVREGDDLVITATPSIGSSESSDSSESSEALAKNMRWQPPGSDPPQTGLVLRVEGIQQDQSGAYNFSYRAGPGVVVSEFFNIAVIPQNTTKTPPKSGVTFSSNTTNRTLSANQCPPVPCGSMDNNGMSLSVGTVAGIVLGTAIVTIVLCLVVGMVVLHRMGRLPPFWKLRKSTPQGSTVDHNAQISEHQNTQNTQNTQNSDNDVYDNRENVYGDANETYTVLTSPTSARSTHVTFATPPETRSIRTEYLTPMEKEQSHPEYADYINMG